jgi:hypothetical protein
MRTFEEIYATVNLDVEPPSRSIYEIKTLLIRAYELAENNYFVNHKIFDDWQDTPIAIHRTTAKRMILEIEQLEGAKTFCCLASQGMELLIMNIYIADRYLNTSPEVSDLNLQEPILAGQLRAAIRYLIDSARTGIIKTKELHIANYLDGIEIVEDKVKWLKRLLLTYKQSKESIDDKQYNLLIKFIKIEKKKWQLDIIQSKDVKSSNSSISVAAGGIVNVSHGSHAIHASSSGIGAQQNISSSESPN